MAYNKLSTANLPDPVIDPAQGSSPEDYFGIDTYSGNGGTIDSDFGFDCDLVWYKNRGRANTFHYLFDQVRGDDLPVYSDLTSAEDSQFPTYHTQSFITGGSRIVRTLGDHLNFSGDSYVAWAWKANGSGVSNTDGTTTGAVTVSANQEAGFSIVKYVGQHSTGGACTIGHGLNAVPSMIIAKQTSGGANDWPVYHVSEGAGKFGKLNGAVAFVSESTVWNNTAPTTDVFSVGSGNLANNNGQDYIAYVFADVEGFSKFGSYTGNGGGGGTSGFDGPFVYTGFRPSFVLVKNASAGWNWIIWDAERDTYNQVNGVLQPNTSGDEYDVGGYMSVDFLSNGFKIRSNDSQENGSGNTHIYMAFAENPFKYSNAR